MTKLMELDYIIQYRKGKENLATDALSRYFEEGSLAAITTIVPDWCQEVVDNYKAIGRTKELL